MSRMFDGYPDVMNVEEMRRALHIGRSMAYELLDKRKIQSFRIGRSIKIPKKCIEEYITGEMGGELHDQQQCAGMPVR